MTQQSRALRFLIISDAWHPQINGVVRTLVMTVRELEKLGHTVRVVGPEPETNLTIPLPGYSTIRLEFFATPRIGKIVDDFAPDCIHIATEGPLGWAARHVCLTRRLAFTTAYHTCFPEYVAARVAQYLPPCCVRLAQSLTYMIMRHFHAPSGAVLVATPSIEDLLRRNGFNPARLQRWSRGVDTDNFRPETRDPALYAHFPRPVMLYVGRVAIEKNIGAFLDADLPGSKVVVGDGPQRAELAAAYPQAHFIGEIRAPEQLAPCYAGADVLVFPSQTDTFGLVMLEALACGLPVAACPAPGARDIAATAATHEFMRLDADLAAAARHLCAAKTPSQRPRAFVMEHFSWRNCTTQFITQSQTAVAPPRRKFWRMILADTLLSLPGQLYNYGGVRQVVRGGRKIWEIWRKVSTQYFK